MQGRSVFCPLLILLMLGLLVSSLHIQPVRAIGTIYIRADGSIDPPTAPIQRNGGIYTLTGDISSSADGIIVERDYVILDGNGHVVRGTGAYTGVALNGRNGVTIRSMKIENFETGIILDSATNNSMLENTLTANSWWAIALYTLSDYNTIFRNTITNNGAGIYLYEASNNNITANSILANTWEGIFLNGASNNVLRSNTMADNRFNFEIWSDYLNDIDTSNTVDGKPIYYWVSETEKAVPSDAGCVALVNCTGITVQGLDLKKNSPDILLAYTTNSTIARNTITSEMLSGGIYLWYSSGNSIIENEMTTCIILEYSPNCNIRGNTFACGGLTVRASAGNRVEDNVIHGKPVVYLEGASNKSVTDAGQVILINCEYIVVKGLDIYDTFWGLTLRGTNNCMITNNILASNSVGIGLADSSNNDIVANDIASNSFAGIGMYRASDNSIYHNNFIANSKHVFVSPVYSSSFNLLDDGYPSGGNYWSNYAGVDVKSGPNQNQSGSDGIGDTPYTIDANNTDHYPLMSPWVPPPYNVTILSRCDTEGADVNVTIFMDGSSTGRYTPYTFAGLDGFHTFAVLGADAAGHPFSRWSTGQTSTTITVFENGTYTAYYAAPALSGNVTRVPQDYASIQAAIDAAASGSTIVIGPGVYNESIIVDKNLTIVGMLGSEPIFNGGGSGIAVTLLPGASGSVISGIVITSWDEGILINGASECKIYNNIMSQIGNCGIAVHGSSALDNIISSNIFENTAVAVDLSAASCNNTVYRNIISTNAQGILLGSSKNIVCANTLIGNSIALNLTGSANNLVFHNNFVNNTVQVSASTSTENTWDNGYPSGGNYWSGHTGPDIFGGSNQDQGGSDGIVDTAYTVAVGGIDRYPLVRPFNAHDVGITDYAVSKTVVGKGYTLSLEVKILNYGVYDEHFLVTVYANTSTAAAQEVTLTKSNSIILTLACNTISFDYGNYSVNVQAEPVLNETNTADNVLCCGTVYVGIPGDINGDGGVDIYDAIVLSNSFMSVPGGRKWSANANINNDNMVDIYDAIILAGNYGKTA